jgi:hypothetical protein
MALTAAQARQFRSLIKQDGRLGHLLPLLPPDLQPRKRGRSELDDTPMLENLELFVRAAKREWGMSREAALHWMFDYSYQEGGSVMVPRYGSNADAVVARLKRKLREGGFDKRDIKTLAPPEWIDGAGSFRPRCPPRSRVIFAALCALSAFPLTEMVPETVKTATKI